MRFSLLLAVTMMASWVTNASLLYPFGPNNGDSQVIDEVTHFRTPKRLSFFGKRYKNLFICSNGLVSFRKPYCVDYALSYPKRTAVMGLFRIAQDISSPTANIWYRATRDPETLQRAASDVSNHFDGCRHSDFRPQQVVVITWQNVSQYDACQADGIPEYRCDCLFNPPQYLDLRKVPKYCDCMLATDNSPEYCECVALDKTNGTLCLRQPKTEFQHSNAKREVNVIKTTGLQKATNTYQLVIISDWSNTFVSLHYDHLGWISANQFITNEEGEQFPIHYKAVVGFLGRDSSFYMLPNSLTDALFDLAATSNVGVDGRHMFEISSHHVLDPQCRTLTIDSGPSVLYPFGPAYGDKAGPAFGFAGVHFPYGYSFYGQIYHNLWISSYAFLAASVMAPEDPSTLTQSGFNFYKARHDLLTSYQSDAVYSEYYATLDNELMLSKKFWYRLTSSPAILARAKADIQRLKDAEPDFNPTTAAVITWYRALSVDECARHGLTPELCDCLFASQRNASCRCLVKRLKATKKDFGLDRVDTSSYSCDDQALENTPLFLADGPYTEENTYQIVLVTDSFSTYAILNYGDLHWYVNHYFFKKYEQQSKEMRIEYAEMSVKINSKTHPSEISGSKKLLDLQRLSNVGIPGRLVFRVPNSVEVIART